MHGNAYYHNSKRAKSFLVDDRVQVMDWPARGPDLNLIENIWKIIGDMARTQNPLKIRRTLGVLENWMEQNYANIVQKID